MNARTGFYRRTRAARSLSRQDGGSGRWSVTDGTTKMEQRSEKE
ncbi:hypothetical protein BURMUCF1_2943 [Burkholderia multivorans ATCC BAA-247]|nr:hypothetical protein BURMUCF1_2943 [Burkholderia multivorans ATCC BAA-247]